jgi:hypothetical protein
LGTDLSPSAASASLSESLRTFAVLGWFVAFAVALLDGGDWWSLHTRLTIVGWVTETVGITLLAVDVLAAPAKQFAARAWEATRRTAALAWSVILRRRRPQIIHGKAGLAIATMGGSGIAHRIPPTLEEQIEELRRVQGELEGKVNRLGDELRAEIARVRDHVLGRIDDRLAEERAVFRPLRLYGFAIALLGSSLLAAANLL